MTAVDLISIPSEGPSRGLSPMTRILSMGDNHYKTPSFIRSSKELSVDSPARFR